MRRNKLRTNDNPLPCSRIVCSASAMLAEFQQGKQSSVGRINSNLVRWQPPSGSSVKANFDGAVFGGDQEAGIGVVIRNNEGRCWRRCRRSQVCFEGDSKLVVKSLQSGLVSNALVGHLVKDIMSIRGHFLSSNIIHVRRQGNNVAHALARDACLSFPLRVWMEEVPPNISCFVVKDLP
nr:hypothetical protein CFP56_13567 [Quercus suber]